MELLDYLKERYPFRKVEFVNHNLIETEQGLKRIRYWENKELLDWHIEWRDRCSVTPCILIDRMIRTKDKQAFARWENGWLTVHDELNDSFKQNGKEAVWGQLLGTMIKHGLTAETKVTAKEKQSPKFNKLPLHTVKLDEGQRQLLQRCIEESNYRVKKSEQLLTRSRDEVPPLLDPIYSLHQAQQMYNILVWKGGDGRPERSYRSLCALLSDWCAQHGEASLQELLDEIERVGELSREQCLLLVSECLLPYELDRVVDACESTSVSATELKQTVDYSLMEWERSRHLVQALSRWVDKNMKVVTQK